MELVGEGVPVKSCYLMKGNNEDIVLEDRKNSVIHLCVFLCPL